MISSRGGHAQLFFESPIAIPQLEGSTSAIAIPQLFKEMLLHNRNSAIPQPQLRNFAIAIFSEFFTTGCYLLLRVFKGTVARDFLLLLFKLFIGLFRLYVTLRYRAIPG